MRTLGTTLALVCFCAWPLVVACDGEPGGEDTSPPADTTQPPADTTPDIVPVDVGGGDVSSEPISCDPYFGQLPTCGGNLAGTWYLSETCSHYNPFATLANECPGMLYLQTNQQGAGSIAFNANATYSRRINIAATTRVEVPNACVTAQGGCLNFQAYAQPFSRYPLTCRDVDGACQCTATFTLSRDDSGTFAYSPAPGLVGLNTPSGTEYHYYCVHTQQAQLREDTPDPDAGEFAQVFYRATAASSPLVP